MESAQFQSSLDLVITLFERWTDIYGAKLQGRQNLSLQTAETWAVSLKLMNMSMSEFEQAAAMSLCFEWPPTATHDFLALVRTNPASQYPQADEAFVIACSNCGMRGDVQRKWKHGVIYETANRIGWGRLASASEGFFKTFKSVYDQVCQEHASGKSFVIEKSHRIAAPKHEPVQAGSEADRKISEQLAKWRSKAVAV